MPSGAGVPSQPKRAGTIPLANSGAFDPVLAYLPECGFQSAKPAAQQPDMRTEIRTPAGLRRLSGNSPAISGTPALPGRPQNVIHTRGRMSGEMKPASCGRMDAARAVHARE